MDLSFGKEYDEFRAEVKDFIANNRDKAPKARSKPEVGTAWQKRLIEHGYTARTIPTKYGGYGAKPDIIKSRIIAEEFGSAGVPQGMGVRASPCLSPHC